MADGSKHFVFYSPERWSWWPKMGMAQNYAYIKYYIYMHTHIIYLQIYLHIYIYIYINFHFLLFYRYRCIIIYLQLHIIYINIKCTFLLYIHRLHITSTCLQICLPNWMVQRPENWLAPCGPKQFPKGPEVAGQLTTTPSAWLTSGRGRFGLLFGGWKGSTIHHQENLVENNHVCEAEHQWVSCGLSPHPPSQTQVPSATNSFPTA